MEHWLILSLGSDPMELPLAVALTDISGEGFKLEGFVWPWLGRVKKGKPRRSEPLPKTRPGAYPPRDRRRRCRTGRDDPIPWRAIVRAEGIFPKVASCRGRAPVHAPAASFRRR